MANDGGFGRRVDAAIATHELRLAYGTSTLQLLSRLLLMKASAKIAPRCDADVATTDNLDAPDGQGSPQGGAATRRDGIRRCCRANRFHM